MAFEECKEIIDVDFEFPCALSYTTIHFSYLFHFDINFLPDDQSWSSCVDFFVLIVQRELEDQGV